MLVMPSNSTGLYIRDLAARYPDRLGHLMGPEDGGWRPPFLPYALDNGAWGAFKRGERFRQREYLGLCEKAVAAAYPPLWLAVPDVVGDRDATLRNWEAWQPSLAHWYGWPLAFVAQDRMTAGDVPQEAAVVFIGGKTRWKRKVLRNGEFRRFPRVHVGRINTARWLWLCAEVGVESIDGTGWFHENDHQRWGLEAFLAQWTAGVRARSHGPLFEEATR